MFTYRYIKERSIKRKFEDRIGGIKYSDQDG